MNSDVKKSFNRIIVAVIQFDGIEANPEYETLIKALKSSKQKILSAK